MKNSFQSSLRPILCSCTLLVSLWAMAGVMAEQIGNSAEPNTGAAMPSLAASFADSLEEFPQAARERLAQALAAPSFEGVLSAALVEDLLNISGGGPDTVPALMLALLPLASRYALPPISDFRVGAVAEGQSGALYLGANLEVAGSALGFTVHAEQSAMNNALLHGEQGIVRIAVTAPPCGHCRQFMNELHAADTLTIIVPGEQPVGLRRLLPRAFGPLDLGQGRGLFAARTPGRQCLVDQHDALDCRGIAAMRHSYAPYSGSPATVTVRSASAVATGAYIENAAYNPSLPPLQSALDRLRFKQPGIGGISEVVLVQVQSARISQRDYTRAVLAALAPTARFKVLTVE